MKLANVLLALAFAFAVPAYSADMDEDMTREEATDHADGMKKEAMNEADTKKMAMKGKGTAMKDKAHKKMDKKMDKMKENMDDSHGH